MNFLRRILLIKLWINRSYSHFSVPLGLLNTGGLIAIYLKLNDIGIKTSILITVALFLVFLIVGYFDVKFGIFSTEQSLSNEHNPEIQAIVRGMKK